MSMKQILSKLLALIAILGVCLSLAAADVVTRIKVVDVNGGANQSSLEQLVSSTIGTKVGQLLILPQLSKDIAALIKTPGVENAQTKVDTLEDGTLMVTYLITLKNRISAIRLEGNTEYSTKTLLKLTKSAVGKPADDIQVAADRRAILDKYEKAGYYGTQVFSRMEKDSDGQRTILLFIVKENRRSKIQGVAFEGNTVIGADKLEDAIYTRRPWWRYVLRFGNYYNPLVKSLDIDKIVTLYGTVGYLDCQVLDVELRYEDESQKWVTPIFKISEGTQYKLGKRTFSGNQKFTTEQLLRRCRLKEGDVYNTALANADLNAMKAGYEALGYLDLRFYPVTHKNPATGVVDVEYQISEGEPSRIAHIRISGNVDTKDSVIRRELTIHEDDLADQRRINQSKQRLQNLGYFSSVEMVPKATANPGLRDLDIQVQEKPTGSISLGAGFSTEDSVMGFLELQETNFSLARLLKLEKPKGDGQRMRSYIGIGSETQSVSISLTEPSLFDSQFEWSNEIFLHTRYEDEYDERHIGFSSMLSWPIAFRIPFIPEHVEYWRIGTGLRIENIRISDLDDEEKFDIHDESDPEDWRYPKGMNYSMQADEGSEFANRLVLSLTRDTRNHFMFPNRGSRINLNLEYITRALGSYADYFKFHAGAETYMPVYDDVFMRLSLNGYTVDHMSGDPVRIHDRYFAGGYGTIRGFKRHDVSPVNRNENSIGGNTMVVGTLEFIKPIKNFMFLKVFTDVGNVWWDSWDANLSELNASIGIGVQFRKLPIRLDYGYPIVTEGDHLDGRSGRLHFSIDYSF